MAVGFDLRQRRQVTMLVRAMASNINWTCFGTQRESREGTPSTAKGTVSVELAGEIVVVPTAEIDALGLD